MAIRTVNASMLLKGAACALAPARGFTYIGVLVLIAVMGLALAGVGRMWHTLLKREKEQELLFIGNEFRHALIRYAQHSPDAVGRAPLHLDDLLKDPRSPGIQRYLRKIYTDPMTGKAEWGMVTGPNDEIYGIYSLSGDAPLKKSNFGREDRSFEGKTKYSDWVFIGVAVPQYGQPLKTQTLGAEPGAE